MTKKAPPKRTRAAAKTSAGSRPASQAKAAAAGTARKRPAAKTAATPKQPGTKQPGAKRSAPKQSGSRARPAAKPAGRGEITLAEPLQKGDMVVVRMRSDWELEGELRAINDEVVRVFDFAVCDVLRLRRKDIERIERLVDAD